MTQAAKQDWLYTSGKYFNFGTQASPLQWVPVTLGSFRKLVITFSARCAVNGSTNNWWGARIVVKDPNGNITAAAPTSLDKALCSGNGTTTTLVNFKANELDGFTAVAMTGVKSTAAGGKYAVAVEFYKPVANVDDISGIIDAILTVFDQPGTIILP